MSVDEQIAILESEKQSFLVRHEERIAELRRLRPAAAQESEEAPPIRPGSRFHPVPTRGMPASEVILRDRG